MRSAAPEPGDPHGHQAEQGGERHSDPASGTGDTEGALGTRVQSRLRPPSSGTLGWSLQGAPLPLSLAPSLTPPQSLSLSFTPFSAPPRPSRTRSDPAPHPTPRPCPSAEAWPQEAPDDLPPWPAGHPGRSTPHTAPEGPSLQGKGVRGESSRGASGEDRLRGSAKTGGRLGRLRAAALSAPRLRLQALPSLTAPSPPPPETNAAVPTPGLLCPAE